MSLNLGKLNFRPMYGGLLIVDFGGYEKSYNQNQREQAMHDAVRVYGVPYRGCLLLNRVEDGTYQCVTDRAAGYYHPSQRLTLRRVDRFTPTDKVSEKAQKKLIDALTAAGNEWASKNAGKFVAADVAERQQRIEQIDLKIKDLLEYMGELESVRNQLESGTLVNVPHRRDL